MKRFIRLFSLLLVSLLAAPGALAATELRGSAYLSSIGGVLYRVNFYFDGTDLHVSDPTPAALLNRGGGTLSLSNHRVAVAGAGNIAVIDPLAHTIMTGSSGTNANTIALDPGGTKIWVGWKDTALAEVTLSPFGNSTAHSVTGDDSVATTLAFTPSNGVFYSTGGESENGNFGRITVPGFVTTRDCAACFATTASFDPFTGKLVLAGLGRAQQRDPANPGVIVSSRDDSAGGENYLSLYPTGHGHLIGTRSGNGGRLVVIDYSATGLIGDASTVIASAQPGNISSVSGAAGFDADLTFPDGLESISAIGM